MSPAEFARRMSLFNNDGDTEGRHRDADELIIECLRSLGYADGCDMFDALNKWYA